ncbi:MAG: GGDEF domain-containing protein [Desulfovibrio sp.]|nr:GGDEF domain-containing protein [Desulfovibrio sp.]
MTYSFAGLLAIIIVLISNSNILYNNRWVLLPEERSYRFFLFSVIIYLATDALWGLSYEQKIRIPFFIVSEIWYAVIAVTVFLWTKFVLGYLRIDNTFSKILYYTGIIFCTLQIIADIVNIFTPIFFHIDSNAEYHALPIRTASFIIQEFIFLGTSIYTAYITVKTHGQTIKRYATIGLFGLAMIVAIAFQLVYPELPAYTVGYLVGCCVLHTFVLEDAKAEYRAKHDKLTDLPNGIFLSEQLPEAISKARKNHLCVGLLHINVDGFKGVNSCYGYHQGDAILCEIARRLRDLVPAQYLARPNTDNFLIILVGKNQDLLVSQANNVLSAMKEPFAVQDNSLYIGVSMGLAVLDADCDREIDLVHCAELAMFEAKKHDGNTISLYEERMKSSALDKKQLEDALHNAVDNNAFTVYYQPKVDISKNDVIGCEALVRWQGSDGRWISPAVFIPVAEETGLVTRIDMFVLRSACRQVLAWQKDGSGAVPVSVNMSVRSILSNGFADNVLRILKEEGTPPSLIDIEITESSFMSDMNTALKAISRLHDAGLHVELDDFGTGYSSLKYLSAMPISVLKIDKTFVDDIYSGKETAQPLVKSIISLADSLGMLTVSEGVEDKNQLAFLVSNGAHVVQGYLFSKPLSAADFGEFLRNRKARIASVMQAG